MKNKIFLFSILALSQNLMCPNPPQPEENFLNEITPKIGIAVGDAFMAGTKHVLTNQTFTDTLSDSASRGFKTTGNLIGKGMADVNNEVIGNVARGLRNTAICNLHNFMVPALVASAVSLIGFGSYKIGMWALDKWLRTPKTLTDFSEDEKQLRFSDFEGTDAQKKELKKQIDIIKAQKETNMNCANLLFNGEPGTGKTFFAAIIANELGLKAKKLELANIAKAERPAEEFAKILNWAKRNNVLLFVDEADQILNKRSKLTAEFLKHTGGADSKFTGVIILATNVVIEEAVQNRFNVIGFELPDQVAREQLIKKFAGKLKCKKELGCLDEHHITNLAKDIAGLSGRQIKDVMLKVIQPLGYCEKIITKSMVNEEFKTKLDSHKKRRSASVGEYVRYDSTKDIPANTPAAAA